MTRVPFLLVLLAAAALGACAGKPPVAVSSAAPQEPAYGPARLVAGESGPPVAVPVPHALATEPLAPPAVAKAKEAGPPLARVASANRSAEREPSRAGYVNAVQVYDWTEGALYRLYTAPGRVSEIALQPGETLISVAAGDTVRWVIGDTVSGAGAARRTHILVKPTAAGLRTNLVIATDRRVYHVSAQSSAGPAMASISWSYPRDGLLVVDRADAARVPAAGPYGLDLETLNFGYAIEGDHPSWRPLRAFDDGTQVFIEFPERFGQDQAPPLFVSGEGGRPELVNYRVRGRFYVVDRLFAAAELRLGERRQQVVRIVAHKSARPRRDDR